MMSNGFSLLLSLGILLGLLLRFFVLGIAFISVLV